MNKKYYIDDSKIHGKGVMAAKNLSKDEIVDLGIGFNTFSLPYVTPEFGSFINHSYTPTTYLWYYDGIDNINKTDQHDIKDSGWYVRAIRNLKPGQEITLNYNNTPWYIEKALPHYV